MPEKCNLKNLNKSLYSLKGKYSIFLEKLSYGMVYSELMNEKLLFEFEQYHYLNCLKAIDDFSIILFNEDIFKK
jgi:hypothetical protein